MTPAYVDLSDPVRKQVAIRATEARMTLEAARRWLKSCGFEQVRIDQYRHPETQVVVETGYTYGEARLVVHGPTSAPGKSTTDFRMVGGNDNAERYQVFKKMVAPSV